MSTDAFVSLTAAQMAMTNTRLNASLIERHLQFASQLQPMPEGFVDLMDDVASLQRCMERLARQIEALAAGQPLPP